jgi:hypothetical protein
MKGKERSSKAPSMQAVDAALQELTGMLWGSQALQHLHKA